MNYKKYLRGLLVSAMCVALIGCGNNTGTLEENKTENISDSIVSENTGNTIIDLNNDDVIIEGSGVEFSNDVIRITEEGSYTIKGSATGVMLKVDAGKKALVNITLDNVNISNKKKAAVFVSSAKKVNITLTGDNSLSASKEIEAVDEVKVDGVIFAKSDLTFDGDGSLTVKTEKNHAVVVKDDLNIKSGTFLISAKKHGFQCKDNVVIDGGNIDITDCNEGIEGHTITVNGGSISINASDDGMNAAGVDMGDPHTADSESWIIINGGNIYINASGDGVDSNGDLTVNGGALFVDGPTSGADAALDATGTSIVNGGVVVAVGNSGMAENFSKASTSPSIYVSTAEMVTGDVLLKDTDGNVIFSFSPKKEYNSVIISHEELQVGNKYIVTMGEIENEVDLTEITYGEAAGFDGRGDFGDFKRHENFGEKGDFKPEVGQAPPEFDKKPRDDTDKPPVGVMK